MNSFNYNSILKNNEMCWEQYYDEIGNLRYIVITKNYLRNTYYLICVDNKKRKEIAKSSNPSQLKKYIMIGGDQ